MSVSQDFDTDFGTMFGCSSEMVDEVGQDKIVDDFVDENGILRRKRDRESFLDRIRPKKKMRAVGDNDIESISNKLANWLIPDNERRATPWRYPQEYPAEVDPFPTDSRLVSLFLPTPEQRRQQDEKLASKFRNGRKKGEILCYMLIVGMYCMNSPWNIMCEFIVTSFFTSLGKKKTQTPGQKAEPNFNTSRFGF